MESFPPDWAVRFVLQTIVLHGSEEPMKTATDSFVRFFRNAHLLPTCLRMTLTRLLYFSTEDLVSLLVGRFLKKFF